MALNRVHMRQWPHVMAEITVGHKNEHARNIFNGTKQYKYLNFMALTKGYLQDLDIFQTMRHLIKKYRSVFVLSLRIVISFIF